MRQTPEKIAVPDVPGPTGRWLLLRSLRKGRKLSSSPNNPCMANTDRKKHTTEFKRETRIDGRAPGASAQCAHGRTCDDCHTVP